MPKNPKAPKSTKPKKAKEVETPVVATNEVQAVVGEATPTGPTEVIDGRVVPVTDKRGVVT